jgi:hypothetical protein
MPRVWARLIRNGGNDESSDIPSNLDLTAKSCYIGRFPYPNPKNEYGFTQTTQLVIPCLFVSATHFSIEQVDFDDGSVHYFIKDYSRNGAFLNDQLIGVKPTDAGDEFKGKELHDNDIISLKYKNEVKISYQFQIVKEEEEIIEDDKNNKINQDQPTSIVSPSKKLKRKHSREEDDITKSQQLQLSSASSSSSFKRNDSTSDVFLPQITNLQNENKQLENRCSILQNQLELQTKENDKVIKKGKQDEKLLIQAKNEIEELKERILGIETNSSTIIARNTILSEQIDDIIIENKEFKQKNNFLLNEVNEKNAQLEQYRILLDEQNKVITVEKKQKHHQEAIIHTLKKEFEEMKEKQHELTFIKSSLETTIQQMKEENLTLIKIIEEKSQYIQIIQEISEKQKLKIEKIEYNFSFLLQSMKTMKEEVQEIDKIPPFTSSLEIPKIQNEYHLLVGTNGNGEKGGSTTVQHVGQTDNNTLDESYHLQVTTVSTSNNVTDERKGELMRMKTNGDLPIVHHMSTLYESTQANNDDGMDHFYLLTNVATVATQLHCPDVIVSKEAGTSSSVETSKVNGMKAPFEEELVNNSNYVLMKDGFDPSTLLSQESVIRKSLDSGDSSKLSQLTSSKEVTPIQQEKKSNDDDFTGSQTSLLSNASRQKKPRNAEEIPSIPSTPVKSTPNSSSRSATRGGSAVKGNKKSMLDDSSDNNEMNNDEAKHTPMSSTKKNKPFISPVISLSHALSPMKLILSQQQSQQKRKTTKRSRTTSDEELEEQPEISSPKHNEETDLIITDDEPVKSPDRRKLKKNKPSSQPTSPLSQIQQIASSSQIVADDGYFHEEEQKPLERMPSNGSILSSSLSLNDKHEKEVGLIDRQEEFEERQRTAYEY